MYEAYSQGQAQNPFAVIYDEVRNDIYLCSAYRTPLEGGCLMNNPYILREQITLLAMDLRSNAQYKKSI